MGYQTVWRGNEADKTIMSMLSGGETAPPVGDQRCRSRYLVFIFHFYVDEGKTRERQ